MAVSGRLKGALSLTSTAMKLGKLNHVLRKAAAINGFKTYQIRAHGTSTDSRRYQPRRAMLYVPGDDERKVKKVTSLNVDCAVMDCEDGVAINRKEAARHNIVKMLCEMDFGHTEAAVRVNAVSSGLAEDDIDAVMSSPRLPSTLMLPKVESPAELDWFAEKMETVLRGRPLKKKFRLVTFVESAIGMLNLNDTFRRARELEDSTPFYLDGVVFGSDDFCADIGATRTEDARELLYARQHVVLVAKAYGVQAIDLVHINYKDLDGLRVQSEEGCRMGFTGKQVIHPAQVPVVQEAFSPSPEKLEWATELIKAFDEHQASGKGAFTFRGHMIDMPLLLQAKNIVQMSQVIRSSPDS